MCLPRRCPAQKTPPSALLGCLLALVARAQAHALSSELSVHPMLEASPLAAFSEDVAKMDVGVSANFSHGQPMNQSARCLVYFHACPQQERCPVRAEAEPLGRYLLLALKAPALAHQWLDVTAAQITRWLRVPICVAVAVGLMWAVLRQRPKGAPVTAEPMVGTHHSPVGRFFWPQQLWGAHSTARHLDRNPKPLAKRPARS